MAKSLSCLFLSSLLSLSNALIGIDFGSVAGNLAIDFVEFIGILLLMEGSRRGLCDRQW